jgi:cell surface protein SprA
MPKTATKVIADPAIVNAPLDNSTLDVGTVNIEENGTRTPIPYVLPPGIDRQRDYNNLRTDTRLNEQSLPFRILKACAMAIRGRPIKRSITICGVQALQMFIHAEGDQR